MNTEVYAGLSCPTRTCKTPTFVDWRGLAHSKPLIDSPCKRMDTRGATKNWEHFWEQ